MEKANTVYNKEGDTVLIEIKLKSLKQLYNSYDPAPFLEKDLDDDAVDYIVSSVKEFSLKTKHKLVLYFPKHIKKKIHPTDLITGIHTFFDYRRIVTMKRLTEILNEARSKSLIAFLFLFICLLAAERLSHYEGIFSTLVSEGFIITGWVAMWRPLDAILYDWLPVRHNAKVYEKISKMDIQVIYD